MSSKTIMAIAIAMMFAIEILLISTVGRFEQWQEIAFVVPLVMVALMAGIDLTRKVLALLPQPKDREARGTMIIVFAFIFAPLPATALLYLLVLLIPGGKVGTVDSLFEAWRIAGGLAIMHGFLHLADLPNSFRSLWRRWRESSECERRSKLN